LKTYNRWKELATSQECTPTIVAQQAEYKKKLFEAFPAEFYWAKIDFSKMTKNIKRKGFDVHKLPTPEQTQQLGMLGGHKVSSSARVSIKHGMEAVAEDSHKPPAMVGRKPMGQDDEEPGPEMLDVEGPAMEGAQTAARQEALLESSRQVVKQFLECGSSSTKFTTNLITPPILASRPGGNLTQQRMCWSRPLTRDCCQHFWSIGREMPRRRQRGNCLQMRGREGSRQS
jgi:hypothetical protein